MKRKIYTKPSCLVIRMYDDLMNTMPVGGSQDQTDSGDDSGAGLSKGNIFDEEENSNVWDDK